MARLLSRLHRPGGEHWAEVHRALTNGFPPFLPGRNQQSIRSRIEPITTFAGQLDKRIGSRSPDGILQALKPGAFPQMRAPGTARCIGGGEVLRCSTLTPLLPGERRPPTWLRTSRHSSPVMSRDSSETADSTGGSRDRRRSAVTMASANSVLGFRPKNAFFIQYGFAMLQVLPESCSIHLPSTSQHERVEQ